MSVVHALPSSQESAVCVQPFAGSQASTVQASLSSQEIFACAQPDVESQESVVQRSVSSQLAGVPETHAPPPQVSFTVHASLSSQGSVFGVPRHAPFTGLQLSVVQRLLSSQLFCRPGVHLPRPSQYSCPIVHTLWSEQVVFATRLKFTHFVAAFGSVDWNVHACSPGPRPYGHRC